MKPPPFKYLRPDSLDEALALLADLGGQARLLAGGQSLVPQLNQRLTSCAALIDLNRIGDLSGISVSGNWLRIGAMTRQNALEADPLVTRHFPEISALLPCIGFQATRHRGTVGGSLAWADPTAELPALSLALDGDVELRSVAGGTRRLSIEAFLTAPFANAARPEELLVALELPIREPVPPHFAREVNVRSVGKAMAGIIASAPLHREPCATVFAWADRARRCRIAVPPRGRSAPPEDWLEPFEQGAAASPWQTDAHGSAEYRRFVFGSLIREAALHLGLA